MIAQKTVDSLLTLIAHVFDAHSVVLFLPESDAGAAHLAAAYSAGSQLASAARVEPGKGLVGWILRRNEPLLINAIEQSQPFLGYYQEGQEPEIRAFMGCPLPAGGALCIDSLQSGCFAAANPQVLHRFALLFSELVQPDSAQGLEVDVLYKSLIHIADLRATYKGWHSYLSQMLPLVLQGTGFDYVAFASRPEGSEEYILEGEYPGMLMQEGQEVQFPVTSGIAGWVLRNEEAVHNEGVKGSVTTPLFGKLAQMPEFGSAICVPVVVEKTTCGVICLASAEPHIFSDDLRAFMRLVAEDLARLLDTIALRYRVRSLMPKASLHKLD